jgi:hypothetical protein
LLDRSRRTLQWLRTVEGGNSGLYYEQVPLIAGSQQAWLGLVTWTTGEIPYFVVRHYLGVRFEDGQVVVRPTLYPKSGPVAADLRYRQGRLRIEIDDSGPVKSATLNGSPLDLRGDGSLRLPKNFTTGTIKLTTR